ncbi:fructosamine kinase family protein [Methylomicrobium sp. Wu6]|uniref:fructosamine kinase family protein n=1 Tax=Methylomicrobium sp. Wu6 TaxID=3107928 RepID=UPI002DD6A32C|nr:fructosamine kinase family protein [Methylomicrobium sp. Wu6]MEC4747614.1 fructosamine kinase family protein [Methylomicrobium sp. Wu6]
MNWQAIAERINLATDQDFHFAAARPLGGGDINSAYRLQGRDRSYFVKLNRRELADMFTAEFDGLQEISSIGVVRAPAPIVHGESGTQAFLVLEYLEFGRSDQQSQRLLGRQLAELHRHKQPYFGWRRNNTIGSTLQVNTRSKDWIEFWRERRLGFQLQLAGHNGCSSRLQSQGERLCGALDGLFDGYRPEPSLLHGDLWAGNSAADRQGQPVIFDPACYYGDREADIAMTELFGGYDKDFYQAYDEIWPLDAGYPVRKTLYNLYHILNHLNLFGGGYQRQAENMTMQLLAELGV